MARVAIVTGGTRGIGEAISLALKRCQGMTVAANYAGNEEKAKAFTERTGIAVVQMGCGRFRCLRRRASAQVEAELGPVDVVVNNAGITRDGTILKMSRDMWEDVIRINLGGCFNMAHATFPGMREPQMGPHRQYRLDQRPGRAVRPGQLCRRQVGYPRLHQGAGAGRCARQGDGQRDRAGLYRYRHGRRGARRRAREDRRQDPGRPARAGRARSPAAWRSSCSEEGGFVTGSTLSINGGQHMY